MKPWLKARFDLSRLESQNTDIRLGRKNEQLLVAQVEAAAADLEALCPSNPARASLEGVWETSLELLAVCSPDESAAVCFPLRSVR